MIINWYFSELFEIELKIAIGTVERERAGGGGAASIKMNYRLKY